LKQDTAQKCSLEEKLCRFLLINIKMAKSYFEGKMSEELPES